MYFYPSLEQSEYVIRDNIVLTPYSGNVSRVIIDGGSIYLGDSWDKEILKGSTVNIYLTPSSNSTNYVTINTINIFSITSTTFNFTWHFTGGRAGGISFEYGNGFPTTNMDAVTYDNKLEFYLYVGYGN